MSISKPNSLNINSRVAGLIIIAALMVVVAGCTKNYGRFEKNAEVGLAFRQGDYQPDYQYFYAGRNTRPYAIIGIDRRYAVPSRYWVPFEPEPKQLRKMAGNIYGNYRYYPAGYNILDPDGNIIGVWFSTVKQYSVSVDQQNRTVEVLYRNPENRGGGPR